MKIYFNFLTKFLGLGIISSLALAPFLSQAEGQPKAPRLSAVEATTVKTVNSDFCSRLSTLQGIYLKSFDDHKTNFETKGSGQKDKIDEKRNRADEKQNLAKKKIDNNLIAFGQKFMAVASTSIEKTAISDFETAIHQAIEARRLAVQTALDTFRQGIDASVKARKTGFETARTTFETTVKTAIEKARTDCANNVEVGGIRSALQDSIRVARTKLNAEIKAVDKVGSALKTLTTAKLAAIKKAQSDYQLAKNKALTAFKIVWSKVEKTDGENERTKNSTSTVNR